MQQNKKEIQSIQNSNERLRKIIHGERSKSLLRNRSQHDITRTTDIPTNISSFRHLMHSHEVNEYNLKWVLALRNEPREGSQKPKVDSKFLSSATPFNVAAKQIECQKIPKVVTEVPRNELHKVSHLIRNRIGMLPSNGQLSFEVGLRDYSPDRKSKDLEKNWRTAAKHALKDETPKMYPSYQEMSSIAVWSTKNPNIKTHEALDGYVNFPKYQEIIKEQPKNYNEIEPHKNGNISQIRWELSMRRPERVISKSQAKLPTLSDNVKITE